MILGGSIVLLILAVALPVVAGSLGSSGAAKVWPDQAKLGPVPIPFCVTAGDCTAETDLEVSKELYSGAAIPGGEIEYRIQIWHNTSGGSNAVARDIVVTDILPAGVTYVSDSNEYGFTTVSTTGGQVVWTRPALNPNEYTYLYLRVRLADTAQTNDELVNVVQVTTSDTDIDPTNNVYTNTTMVAADMSVSKWMLGAWQAPQGDEMVYQIYFSHNGGGLAAANVVLTDTLPQGTTFMDWSNDPYVDTPNHTLLGRAITPEENGNQVVWNLDTVEDGDWGYIYALVQISDTVSAGETLTNEVQITSAMDPDVNNDVATLSVQVLAPTRDMAVSKSLHWSGNTPIPGNDLKYQIQVQNLGNAPAHNVVVTDTLPDDTSFVSWSSSSSSYGTNHWLFDREIHAMVSDNQVTWDLGTVRPGWSGTIYVLAHITETAVGGTWLTNTVQIATTDPDTDPGNDVGVHTTTIIPPSRDMYITKYIYNDAAPGGEAQYIIQFENEGNVTARGVVITDTLPANTTFASWYGYIYNPYVSNWEDTVTMVVIGDQVVWQLGEVEPGQYGYIYPTLHVSDTVAVGATLTNTAEVSTSDVDIDPSDNYVESRTTVVSPTRDVHTNKSLSWNSALPVAGHEIQYEIQVGNDGNSPASDVTIVDTLPANTTFVSWSSDPWELDQELFGQQVVALPIGDRVMWRLDTVPANSSAYIYLTVRIDDTAAVRAPLCDYIQISTTDVDIDPANDVYTHTTTVHAPIVDMYAHKSLDSAAGTPGGTMEYSVYFGNDGNTTAENVVVTDTLPVGVSLVFWQGELYNPYQDLDDVTPVINGNQVVWNIGSVTAEQYGYLYLTVRITDTSSVGAVVTNTVSIMTSSDDWDATDDTSVLTTTLAPPQVDLEVYKSLPMECDAAPGSELTYQISIYNNGNWAASDIVVTDTLPVSTTYVSDYNSYGFTTVVTGSQVVWTSPTLDSDESASLYLRVQVPDTVQVGDVLTNTVQVTTSSTDIDPINNVDTYSTIVTTPTFDVSIYKYLYDEAVPGDLAEYAIYFYNEGNREASAWVVTDTLPAGASYVSWYGYVNTGMGYYTPIGGSVSGDVLVWDMGSMPACSYGYIYVTVRISTALQAGDVLTNVVTVSGSAAGLPSRTDTYTHTAIVSPPPCRELTGVEITGPMAGYVGTSYAFAADVTPSNATLPIIYTWWLAPGGTLIPPGQQTASYSWPTPGTKTIGVVAQNCGGVTVYDSHTIELVTVAPVSIVVDPTTGGTLVFTDPQGLTTTVEIPAGAVSETTTIIYTPVPSPTESITAGLRFGNHAFDLDAYRNSQLISGFTFMGTVTVTIRYSNADVVGIDESDLALYRHGPSGWVKIGEGPPPGESQAVYPDENILRAWLRGLSRFGILGTEMVPPPLFLPLVVRNS
jgi:uncharacterized repeat protein (TIGR01451 family)